MKNRKLNSNGSMDSQAIRVKLYVKYMVCLRDKLIAQSVLNKQGLSYQISNHGAIQFSEEITQVQYHELKEGLAKSGLILLDEKESMLIDRIINTIVEIVHYSDTLPKLSFSDIISDYAGSGKEPILKIFSDVKGMSLLEFIVIQKIERAKELMLYADMPLDEIADILNYKNQDYLIAQFKITTGLTPYYFKRMKNERMKIAEKSTSSPHSDAAGATA